MVVSSLMNTIFDHHGLREARERAGFTTTTAAALIGRSTRLIRRYEQDVAPPADALVLLLTAYGASFDDVTTTVEACVPAPDEAHEAEREHRAL